MFTVVNLDPPHQIAFKCTPDSFSELVERPGIIPAPYMARNMWVMEERLGDALEGSEVESLIRTSYDLVVAKLPKSKRPGAANAALKRRATSTRDSSKRKARGRR